VWFIISNLSDTDSKFDVDGIVYEIPAGDGFKCYRRVELRGQTERIYVTKLETQSSGIIVQEQLVLKIEPKGGDVR